MDDDNQAKGGQGPARIMPWRGVFRILYRAGGRVVPDQLSLIAAGVAFYALLAIFPAIAALMSVAGLLTDPDAVVRQLQGISNLLPEAAARIVLNQARAVVGSTGDGLSLTFFLGIGFAVYLMTRATTGLIHGLNIAVGTKETRGILNYWATVILLTTAMFVGSTLLLVLLVGLPALLAFIPLDFSTARLIHISRWGALGLVFLTGVAILYRWGPCEKAARWHILTPGTLVAGLLWFAGSAAFTVYVANFGRYNETFGSLGGVIVLLTWFWLSAYVVLLGALLDAEVDAEVRASREARVGKT